MEGPTLVQPDKSRWTIVRCPGCGDTRQVSTRQAHRQAIGETNGYCRRCLNPPKTFADDDPKQERLRVWWLQQAGILDLGGLDARTYCQTHGVPRLIREINEAISDWLDTIT